MVMAAAVPGPVALVGGDEFRPGNEPQDDVLVAAAHALGRDRPAYVIATAAVRQDPVRAVENARRWFSGRRLALAELPLRTRRAATLPETVEAARRGGFFYLCGGDPGIVATTLRDTQTWAAVLGAWRVGAALAGSSAGAMALGEWTLTRARMPGDMHREARPGLGVVPRLAVLPHFADFGHRWVESAQEVLRGRGAVLVGIDARTAAVWVDGEWRAMGAGGIVVITAGESRRHAAGERIEGIPSPLGIVPSRSGE